jgi:crotonobetainyl-CoA:carnitine CoA-transferase CaiB-like acyl-CoA transferase
VSLFDGALSWAGTIIGGTHAAGKSVERGKMQLNGGMACYNVYATRDGKYITLGAIEPHFWAAFCKAVGRDDLNPRAQEFEAISEVVAIFKTRPFDEWMELFKTIDACIEPVRDFSQMLDDPHVRHRGLVSELAGMKQVGSVFVFAQSPNLPPPHQGEHTREALRGIGLGEEEIAKLHEDQVIKIADFDFGFLD